MPTLCLKCHAEAEGSECEYCASETEWVREIYEIKVGWQCTVCDAEVVKSYDCGNPDFPEGVNSGGQDIYCPDCQAIWPHSPKVKSSRPKLNPNIYLEKAFNEEIDIVNKKRRKKNWY